jgi:hypothetical protein
MTSMNMSMNKEEKLEEEQVYLSKFFLKNSKNPK